MLDEPVSKGHVLIRPLISQLYNLVSQLLSLNPGFLLGKTDTMRWPVLRSLINPHELSNMKKQTAEAKIDRNLCVYALRETIREEHGLIV